MTLETWIVPVERDYLSGSRHLVHHQPQSNLEARSRGKCARYVGRTGEESRGALVGVNRSHETEWDCFGSRYGHDSSCTMLMIMGEVHAEIDPTSRDCRAFRSRSAEGRGPLRRRSIVCLGARVPLVPLHRGNLTRDSDSALDHRAGCVRYAHRDDAGVRPNATKLQSAFAPIGHV
jgi:hypothetical protein